MKHVKRTDGALEQKSRGASLNRTGRQRKAPREAPKHPAHRLILSPGAARSIGLAAILVLLVVAVYAPVRHYDFVSFDDPSYVSENPHVANGVNWTETRWAFTTAYAGYWIPLTWLSYMLVAQVGAGTAGGQHLANVLLHALNTLLLFGVLYRMTGATGRSAFVAALFAVHPLHVESVAWITERKDVLSTFFMMLTLWSYVWYSRAPSARRYLCLTTAFVFSLMAKPMVVTLPLVLLLLDVWPLKRVSLIGEESQRTRGSGSESHRGIPPDRSSSAGSVRRTWRALGREKLVLLGVAFASGVITLLAQRSGGAVPGLGKVGSTLRITTALAGYVTYVFRAIWPSSLAVFYPYSSAGPFATAAVALLVLTAVSVLVIRFSRGYPFLAVGWLWYVITLIPVIGLLQSGMQATADRFTYVPLIGLFIMVAWGVPALLPSRRRALAVVAICVVLVLAVVAHSQVETWKDDSTLWQRALSVTTDNFLAHDFLGRDLYKKGRTTEAAWHFTEAVRLAPGFADGHDNLAMVLLAEGRLDDAIGQYRQGVAIEPTGEGLTALAAALAQRGDVEEGIKRAGEAVSLKPELAEARYNLALMLIRVGRIDEALAQFAEACRLRPDLAQVHAGLAAALIDKGNLNQAVAEYREALRLNGGFAEAHHGLGIALMKQGNQDEALRELTEAVALEPARADFQDDLGFSLAAQGRMAEATQRFADALRLAPDFEAAHYHLGLALAAVGRLQEAVQQFNEVLRLNPGNESARRALAAVPKR